MKVRKQADYIVCIVGGRHERFPESAKALRAASSEELQRVAAAMLAKCPERAASIIQRGDPSSFFVDMYTSVPCSLDAPTNVTLLGDAITMP